jgi:hypothetical protein
MRSGYIVCGLDPDEARLVVVNDLPPALINATDWSVLPQSNDLKFFPGGTYFLLSIPADANGLFLALEEIMDVVGAYREGYVGLENHRRLLDAVGKIRRGVKKWVQVDFALSPERQREFELEFFQTMELDAWSGRQRCLEDPGCAEVLRRAY